MDVMGKINMYWYKQNSGKTNYGDELGPYIVSKLSGKKITYTKYYCRKSHIPYVLYLNTKKNGFKPAELAEAFRTVFMKEILFSVGSIISWYSGKNIVVWGSGVIFADAPIGNARFCAVRGEKTLKRIKELGLPAQNIAIGDPALLLPLLIEKSESLKYEVGLIPHYSQFAELSRRNPPTAGSTIIDLTEPIESVTKTITSCKYILSSSLHGIIVAQAYGIPALWVSFDENWKLSGDDVKFADYFSSVEIEPYSPFSYTPKMREYIDTFFRDNRSNAMVNIDLRRLQKKLIQAAPFSVKNNFMQNIELA